MVRTFILAGIPLCLMACGSQEGKPVGQGGTIHEAVMAGDRAKAESLLAQGVSIHTVLYDHKLTPLHLAAFGWDEGMTRFLLEKGADVKAKDKNGDSPLHVVLRNSLWVQNVGPFPWAPRNREMPDFFRNPPGVKGGRRISEIRAAWSDAQAMKTVAALLAGGADSDAINDQGETPLHMALSISEDPGNPLIARLLIQCGADVNRQDGRGRTVLHQVSWGGACHPDLTVELAYLLLANGAKVAIKDKEGQTPLHVCAHPEIARLLIQHGAQVNEVDSAGNTPLLSTQEGFGPDEVGLFLIGQGADINTKNAKGQSALTIAREQNRQKLIEVLEKRGAAAIHYGGHEEETAPPTHPKG